MADSKDMNLALFASELSKGVELKSRERKDRPTLYPNCFVGREAAQWIMRTKQCGLAEAENVGNELMALGYIKHVDGTEPFKAGPFLYRFQNEEKPHPGTALSLGDSPFEEEEYKDIVCPLLETPEKIPLTGFFTVVSKKRHLDERLREAEWMRTKVAKYTEVRQKRARITFLKRIIEEERGVLDKQMYNLDERRKKLLNLVEFMSTHYDMQLKERQDTIDLQQRLDEKRGELRLLERKMKLRRHKMVYTIGKRVLPLTPATRSANGRTEARKYNIGNHGIYLMHRDQMLTQMMARPEWDKLFATGLGFVCLLVRLLARYLGVYLPAKIRFRGSKSEIRDPSVARTGKRVYLPLYTDCAKEKRNDCKLAIDKLHLNVSHIAHARDLKTSGEFLEDLARVLESLVF